MPELRYHAANVVDLKAKATPEQEEKPAPVIGSSASLHDHIYRLDQVAVHAEKTADRRRCVQVIASRMSPGKTDAILGHLKPRAITIDL
jgi:hypothetical protein